MDALLPSLTIMVLAMVALAFGTRRRLRDPGTDKGVVGCSGCVPSCAPDERREPAPSAWDGEPLR